MQIGDWTVDFGGGPQACEIPHAWRQDVPVSWEGPAVYRSRLLVPHGRQFLAFKGVSYQARVFLDDVELGVHEGIWDAFWFELAGDGGEHELRVEVVKNGGPTFPVREVASGFLPFVFHTFGGIHNPVELASSPPVPSANGEGGGPPRPPAVWANGIKLMGEPGGLAAKASPQDLADQWLRRRLEGEVAAAPKAAMETNGGELYLRGVLSWGWYPEIGHPNPPDAVIRREIDQAKALGFNLVKFCLWVPSHRYLELLHEAGMWAWIELPLWDPVDDGDVQEKIAAEFERIVDQYAHHPNVALWTCGCELHATTGAAYRKRLYEIVKSRTGALVKDNSGSAEMYGGDLREYGDFYDFHPYCEPQFYPEVLDSLLNGPRKPMPILLGEFDDSDVHRDLARLAAEPPYWGSADPGLNGQGVRWQHDLPALLADSRFARAPEEHRHQALMESSRRKAAFIRKQVQEAVRARGEIGGYVVTGWRDTPISTSGMIDDDGNLRFKPEDLASWNGPACLFLIPTRRPPWVAGGNRPGWIDPYNWFSGRAFWKVGIHSETPLDGCLEWDILHFSWSGNRRPKGRVSQGSGAEVRARALEPVEVGEISWETDEPGGYLLRVQFGGVSNSWPFWVVPPAPPIDAEVWDPSGWLDAESIPGDLSLAIGAKPIERGACVLLDEGTAPAPFWRESAYEFHHGGFWDANGYREAWERFLPISTDRTLDFDALTRIWPGRDWEVLMNRIDVRTYREAPMLAVGHRGHDRIVATTLRPFGGLGNCPRGLRRNPSGAEFLRRLLELAT